jgi:hypothetical protein
MNLDLIKAKLAASQQKPGQTYEKIDYSKYYWKPKEGKHQIRIVPSKFDKESPFKEVYFHYGIAKFPVITLSNFGEIDPIIEMVKELRKSKDKNDWALAKKLTPKMRVFIPIIVRGEESMGVRLWEFGKEIYQQLLGIAADEDYGDYTSIVEGNDITVEATKAEAMGKVIIKCTVRPKPKKSKLSESADEVKKWLEEQPDVLELHKKRSFDEISTILNKWLNSEPEEGEVTSETETEEKSIATTDDLPWKEEEESKPVVNKLAGASSKSKNTDKFNKLFQ